MASNDINFLVERLATQLRDTDREVWETEELEDLLTWSAAQLWPRYSRPILPTEATILLVADAYFYLLPAGMRAVSRVDLVSDTDIESGAVFGGAWEVAGDVMADAGELHVSPVLADGYSDWTLRLTGYGAYDLYDYLPADNLVPLVLARARAEAYRRMAGDRSKFKAWLVRNQTQNVSVNELIQFVNDADVEIRRLTGETGRTWQRPVPGRQG